MYYTLIALFLLSRFLFINSHDVFFDSGENLDLFAYSNYFQAIVSGHFPPHEGYIILFWPVFQLAKLFTANPAYIVIIGQIILATITVICFYKMVKYLSDKQTALLSSVIVSILPLFWITNMTIMMEVTYTTFFFLAGYFLIRFLKQRGSTIFLHLAALCFTFSFLTHILILIWFPFLLALVFFQQRTATARVLITFSLYILAAIVFNVLFISAASQETIPNVFNHLYFSKGNEFASLSLSGLGFLVAMRNFLIPLLRNNTSIIVILSFISLILLFKKNKQLFVLGLLWILPAAFANQWWDSLLNGRHALIASFGFAFVTAYLIKNKSVYTTLVILYLLLVSIPIIQLLAKPIPYLEEAEAVKSLPKNSLLIETHFAKPQVQRTFSGKLLAVNDPVSNKVLIQKEIATYLQKKRPVFISSGALSEPYGLYSGPYLHNITLSYANHFEMESIITNYTLIGYKTINASDNLFLYQVISKNSSSYPQVLLLKNSHRRLDYFDPISRFGSLLYNKFTNNLSL